MDDEGRVSHAAQRFRDEEFQERMDAHFCLAGQENGYRRYLFRENLRPLYEGAINPSGLQILSKKP